MISFNEAVQEFDSYIWALAHRFSTKLRGYDASDLHQEGLIKLYELFCEKNEGKTDEHMERLLKRALVNRFIDIRRDQAQQDYMMTTINLDWISEEVGEDAFADLQLQYHQEYLAHFVSADAQRLLMALIEPPQEAYEQFMIQNLRRQHIKAQGFRTSVGNKITHNLIGQVLGFPVHKTKALIHELQLAYREHLCSVPSYKLNAATC